VPLRLDPSFRRRVCRIFQIIRIANYTAHQCTDATWWPVKRAKSLLDPDLKARGKVLRKIGDLIRKYMVAQI
jgi:hypothetical protein